MNRILIILLFLSAAGCRDKSTADTPPSPYMPAAEGERLLRNVELLNTRTVDLVDKVNEHTSMIDGLKSRISSSSRSRSVEYVLDGSLSPDTAIPPAPTDRSPDEIVIRRRAVSDPIFLPQDHLAVKFGKFKEKTNTRFTALEESQGKQDEKLTNHEAKIKSLEAEVNTLREKVNTLGPAEAPPSPAPKTEAPAETAPATAEAAPG